MNEKDRTEELIQEQWAQQGSNAWIHIDGGWRRLTVSLEKRPFYMRYSEVCHPVRGDWIVFSSKKPNL